MPIGIVIQVGESFLLGLLKVRVHGWGGLGSQLFTCIIGMRLAQILPRRSIQLFFHSSGATRREVEFSETLLPILKVTSVSDFQEADKKHLSLTKKKSFRQLARFWLSQLLTHLFLQNNLNDENEFKRLKPWLVTVRGHYTNINLSPSDIKLVLSLLEINVEKSISQEYTAIHLRLGDLLHLNKIYIEPARISQLFQNYVKTDCTLLFSDSKSEEVSYIISDWLDIKRQNVLNLTTQATIAKCIEAKTFIGTNSKISLWISVIRIYYAIGEVDYLPFELLGTFRKLMENFPNARKPLGY